MDQQIVDQARRKFRTIWQTVYALADVGRYGGERRLRLLRPLRLLQRRRLRGQLRLLLRLDAVVPVLQFVAELLRLGRRSGDGRAPRLRELARRRSGRRANLWVDF